MEAHWETYLTLDHNRTDASQMGWGDVWKGRTVRGHVGAPLVIDAQNCSQTEGSLSCPQ